MITIKEINYTISLIRSCISGGSVEEPPESLDWKGFYLFSLRHNITSMINYSISKLPQDIKQNIPLAKQFLAVFKQDLYLDANRQAEARKLSRIFSENKIDFIFLKGYVTKNLYPDTSLRTMRDTDILYRPDTSINIETLMASAGYQLQNRTPKDDAYLNSVCNVYVELHRYLIDKGYESEYNFLNSIWNRAIKAGEHEYIMTDEDFYIYHIIHMSKHVRHSGLGLIHFIDLWLYIMHYQTMDKKYIENSLKKLNLLSFEKYSRMLACQMFYNDSCDKTPFLLEPCSEEEKKILNLYFQYIFNSGSFGSELQMEVNSLAAAAETDTKSSHPLLRRVFPDKITMINYYGDIVEKHFWLIPFFWIYLNICRLFSKDRSFKRKKELINNISEEHIEITKYLMHNLFEE